MLDLIQKGKKTIMKLLRHIVGMTLRKDILDADKKIILQRIKSDLEGLKNVIPCIAELTVHIDLLPTSNMEFVIDSAFANNDAFMEYQVHPAHASIAEFIGTVRADRTCYDYYDE